MAINFGVSTGSYISYAASSETNPMTISMWVNAVSWVDVQNDGNNGNLASSDINLASGWYLGGNSTAGRLYFQHKFSTTSGVWYITAPSTGLHRITITYDGSSTSNNPIFYVDGKSVSVTRSTAPVGTQTLTSSVSHTLGGYTTLGTATFNGSIQDLCINYGTILTAAQELAIYNAKIINASNGLYTFRDPLLTASTSSSGGSIYPFTGTLANGTNYTLDNIGGLEGSIHGSPAGASDLYAGTGY